MIRQPVDVRLTVITPVYNNVRWIERCIRNVIEQDCPEVEHILIDGGSTDGTREIIERYAREYAHIRYVSERDKGQSHAMNKGAAMARGAVIGFLNADDAYAPGALTRALQRIPTLREPGMLVGDLLMLDEKGNVKLKTPGVFTTADFYAIKLLTGRITWFPYNPVSYFYHKSLHDKIGPYDEDNHYTMDMDFLFRAGSACHIKYVPEIFGIFRMLPGTKTVESMRSSHGSQVNLATWNANRHRISLSDRLLLPLWICRLECRLASRAMQKRWGTSGRAFRALQRSGERWWS